MEQTTEQLNESTLSNRKDRSIKFTNDGKVQLASQSEKSQSEDHMSEKPNAIAQLSHPTSPKAYFGNQNVMQSSEKTRIIQS